MSRSVQTLSNASIAALQKLNGAPLQLHLSSHPSSSCHAAPNTLAGSCVALEETCGAWEQSNNVRVVSGTVCVKPGPHLTGVIRTPQA